MPVGVPPQFTVYHWFLSFVTHSEAISRSSFATRYLPLRPLKLTVYRFTSGAVPQNVKAHRGFLQCFQGIQNCLQHHHEVCEKESEGFSCMSSFLFFSSALSLLLILIWKLSNSFYLMWKKNTEINYLIFLML